jgi:Tfp pilus assembly protein PilX
MKRLFRFGKKIRPVWRNQKGAALLMVVIFGMAILASVAYSFFADTGQKQSGSAVAFSSINAFMVAESGLRYAEKCVEPPANDTNCPCGANCAVWTTMADFTTALPAANGRGTFTVAFTNKTSTTMKATATGNFAGAVRKVSKNFSFNPKVVGYCNALKGSSAIASNTVTLSYTVPLNCGTDLILVVSVFGEDANKNNLILNSTSAIFGANTMSYADSLKVNIGGADDIGLGIYYLPVTAGQSGAITVTFAGTVSTRMIQAITLNNTLPTGPEAQVVKDTNSGDTTDTITTLSVNTMIVSSYIAGDAITPTPVGTSGANSHVFIDEDPILAGMQPFNQTAGTAGSGMGYLQSVAAGKVTGIGYSAPPTTNMAQILAAFAPAP